MSKKRVNPVFPEWAPKGLCQILTYSNEVSRHEDHDLVYRLVFDKRMRYVWIEINKRKQFMPYLNKDEDIGELLYIFIRRAIDLTYNQVNRTTILSIYNEIHETGNKYVSLINQYGFNPSLKKLEKRLAEKTIWYGMLEMDKDKDDELTLVDGINYINNTIDAFIKNIEIDKKYLPYENVKHSKRNAFIRILASLFQDNFGQKMYGTLATVTSVVLNDDIDATIVSDVLKKPPRKSEIKK